MAVDFSYSESFSSLKHGETLGKSAGLWNFDKTLIADLLIDFVELILPVMDCIYKRNTYYLIHARKQSL